jgi:cytochrome c biogenesis protein CcmG, thiol:disulfide interchange protein DsbE
MTTLTRERLGRAVTWILWMGVAVLFMQRCGAQLMSAVAAGSPGDPVPAIVVTTLDGDPIDLEALRGEVVLVNFWATWCSSCRMEMPGMERVYESRRDRGFRMVSISTDRGGETVVRPFLESRGITFPVALDRGAGQAFGGVRSLPTSYLIDREGRIRHVVRGYWAEPALRRAVDRLLNESPAPAS